jgi:hypothetical protein
MALRSKLIARHRGARDARLFVVATEGERTEKDYIDSLKLTGIIHPSKVVVEVVPAEAGRSAPEHVLERIELASKRLGLTDDDERWILIDVDRWRDRKLSEVAQLAKQKGKRVSGSRSVIPASKCGCSCTSPARLRCPRVAMTSRRRSEPCEGGIGRPP